MLWEFEAQQILDTRNVQWRVSKYFYLTDLIYSRKAEGLKIDNFPTTIEHILNLERLTKTILEPLVSQYSRIALNTFSIYRTLELNRVLEADCSSKHLTGEAVDFMIVGDSTENVVDFVQTLDFNRLVIRKRNNQVMWLHCDIDIHNSHRTFVHDETGFIDYLG